MKEITKQGCVVMMVVFPFPKKLIAWKVINNEKKFGLDAQKYYFQYHKGRPQMECF